MKVHLLLLVLKYRRCVKMHLQAVKLFLAIIPQTPCYKGGGRGKMKGDGRSVRSGKEGKEGGREGEGQR
jgi:hypothetical protein